MNFRIPGRMPTLYAHHMLVQPGEEEVVLSFFEVIPPLVYGDNAEEQIREIEEGGVIADCVARITIAKKRYRSFVEAMQQILEPISSEQEAGETSADTGRDNQQD